MLSHHDFLIDDLNIYLGFKAPKDKQGTAEIDNEAIKRNELLAPVPYGKMEEMFLCREPREFLHEFNGRANNRDEFRSWFEEKVKGFDTVQLPAETPDEFWWNTTRDQINLRPGIDHERTKKPVAMPLGDITVHGLIAGQTGSGKSVLMHNLIFNLMAEYPPWELDLYLADFKRVEFSKYMDDGRTAPHVSACAATGEIRYVISLIQYIVDCMNAREDFFKRMGFQKIAKFRSAYPQVVMPRILLIVDEFQQLFLDASPKESEHIQRMLTAIVKKGRATGVHFVFASQELSQTLSRSVLSNFRMRMALNCDPNVSMDVLGNRKAAECEVGYVYVNNSDYSENTNIYFQVPHIPTELTAEEKKANKRLPYFDMFLANMHKLADRLRFHKNYKFYQEDFQEPIEKLTDILRNEKIQNFRSGLNERYFDALTLGKYVTYCPQKYDIQTLFIERDRNRNILAVSSNTEDVCYIQKLLAENFNSRGIYSHIVYSFISAAEGIYNLGSELNGSVECYSDIDDLMKLKKRLERLDILRPVFEESDTPVNFAIANFELNMKMSEDIKRRPELKQSMQGCIPVVYNKFCNIDFDNYESECNKIIAQPQNQEQDIILAKIASNVIDFCRYKKDPASVLVPTVIWINGIDIIDRIPDWLMRTMQNGMDNNLFAWQARSSILCRRLRNAVIICSSAETTEGSMTGSE